MLGNLRRSTRAVLLGTVLTVAGSWAANAGPPGNTLYIQTNNPAAGQNAVLGFHRNVDGSLTRLPGSPFLTGGTGFAILSDPDVPLGVFDSENIMAADPVGGVLYVPNGGSDSISALRMAHDGTLSAVQGSPFATGGNTPDALGLRGQTLIIANSATDPAQASSGVGPSYSTARTDPSGQISEITSATVPLAPGSMPTQATAFGLTPLVFTNEIGAGTHSEYILDIFGRLHLLQTTDVPSAALGLDLRPYAPYEYVGLPLLNQVGVYRLHQFSSTFVRGVVATTDAGSAPCWLHVRPDGRYLYSSNTGNSSVSVFDLSKPAAPVLVQTLVLNGVNGGTFDFEFSPDGRYLYLVEGATPASEAKAPGSGNQVHILSVSQTTGKVTEIAASPVNLGEAGHRVQGVVVF